jgi:3-methyladenine DNA glycosylase AlkD
MSDTKVHYKNIHNALLKLAIPAKAKFFPRFFKTGKGEYGEGDRFIGVTVPNQRIISKQFQEAADDKLIIKLLDSSFHEDRLTGLFILIHKFNKDKKNKEEKIWVDLYLKKIDRINNWDLVDNTAHIILGSWLENKDRSILYKFAHATNLWKNRIAIISTFHFIRQHDFDDLLKLSAILINHKHDLIHKAVGWMLREGWKREHQIIELFLNQHAHEMPRTMLRYAIEKMDEKQRKHYMQLK